MARWTPVWEAFVTARPAIACGADGRAPHLRDSGSAAYQASHTYLTDERSMLEYAHCAADGRAGHLAGLHMSAR